MKMSITLFCILAIVTSSGLAMSGKSGKEIPIPTDNFRAVITDIDGVITEAFNVSFNGQTYITVKRGSTETYIPFERIKQIDLQENESVITEENPLISVSISLVDGSRFEATGQSRDEFTGEAGFGRFRIRMDHVRLIRFAPTVTSESDVQTTQ